MTSDFPRTLLVTTAGPATQSAGSVFLKSLLEPDSQAFYWFVLAPQDSQAGSFLDATVDYAYPPATGGPPRPSPRSLGFRVKHLIRQRFGEGPSKLAKQIPLLRREAPCLSRRLLDIARSRRIEVILFVIDSTPLLTYVMAEVCRRWEGRVAINIHDPPTRDADLLRFPFRQLLTWLISGKLRFCLSKASAVALASWNMRQLYGLPEAEVLIHGPDSASLRPASKALKSADTLHIGFAGSLYAQETWLSFLSALDSVNWTVGGRQVMVSLLGNWKPPEKQEVSANIRFLGWATPERCLEVLATCDVAYLPYWFGHDSSVQNCFPNKISMYLAAGIPVFYHGPTPSSPDDFLKRYRAGVSCNSMNSDVVLRDLGQFLNEVDFRGFALEAERASREILNLQVFREAFRRFLATSTDSGR